MKSAFKTRDGLYGLIMMPIGLSNSPSTVICLMNKILQSFIDKFVVFCFDNILICSCFKEDHLKETSTSATTLHRFGPLQVNKF